MMKIVTYINSIDEIDTLVSLGIYQAIISPQKISRFGEIKFEDALKLAEYCREKNILCICEWDLLSTDKELNSIIRQIPSDFLSSFDEIRVQDTGVLNYVLRESDRPIQWIAETAHHNILSLKSMERYIGKRLSRLILSLELPLDKINEFSKELKTPTELLGLGRILLFYTPRKLVSPLMENQNSEKKIEIIANSEESPHRGFPIMQNGHGTFMFNPKDHCILEYSQKLIESDLSFLRIDLRHDFNFSIVEAVQQGISKLRDQKETISNIDWVHSIKEQCPRSLIRGFASVNKTDHQFIKLKNHRIARTDNGYVGQVLDVKKGSYIAIKVKDNINQIRIGAHLKLKTPEGKIKKIKLTKIKNSDGSNTLQVKDEDIIFINHIGGISVRTAVYVSDES